MNKKLVLMAATFVVVGAFIEVQASDGDVSRRRSGHGRTRVAAAPAPAAVQPSVGVVPDGAATGAGDTEQQNTTEQKSQKVSYHLFTFGPRAVVQAVEGQSEVAAVPPVTQSTVATASDLRDQKAQTESYYPFAFGARAVVGAVDQQAQGASAVAAVPVTQDTGNLDLEDEKPAAAAGYSLFTYGARAATETGETGVSAEGDLRDSLRSATDGAGVGTLSGSRSSSPTGDRRASFEELPGARVDGVGTLSGSRSPSPTGGPRASFDDELPEARVDGVGRDGAAEETLNRLLAVYGSLSEAGFEGLTSDQQKEIKKAVRGYATGTIQWLASDTQVEGKKREGVARAKREWEQKEAEKNKKIAAAVARLRAKLQGASTDEGLEEDAEIEELNTIMSIVNPAEDSKRARGPRAARHDAAATN